ncbi:MAG: nucleotidyltransferase family protein [Candidatus Eremiobacteraeota bacterium]|nr:nucleotidyltransferase family protein [Candidatus Eremiobacteraeota bacterium]
MLSGILVGDGLSHKPLWQIQKFKDKPILLHSIEALQNSALDEVILVLGKNYHQILNKIKIQPKKLRIVMNRQFERGISSYIRAGIGMLSGKCDGVLIALGEYPMIKTSLVNRMIEAYKNSESGILVPVYKQEIGNPVIFSKKYFRALKRLVQNDIGTSIIDKYGQDATMLEVKNPGAVKGIDRIKELEDLDTEEIEEQERAAAAASDIKGLKRIDIKTLKRPASSKKRDTTEISRNDLKPPEEKEVKPAAEAEKTTVRVSDSIEFQNLAFQEVLTDERKNEMEKLPDDLSLKMLNDLLGTKGNKPESEQLKEKKLEMKRRPQGRPKKRKEK